MEGEENDEGSVYEMKEHFERYINRLYDNIPNEVFEWGLILFCVGTLGIILFLGWKRGWRKIVGLLLAEYVGLIYCSTVIFRTVKNGIGHNFRPFWSYEAINNGEKFLIAENIMNVVVFVPVGILLGSLLRIKGSWMITLLVGLCVSLLIEAIQYFLYRGFAETDDVMHNTLGCLMGYGLYRIMALTLRCIK